MLNLKYRNQLSSNIRNNSGEKCISYLVFSFSLDDGTGKMSCVCFPSKNDFEAVPTLTDAREVIAMGDIEEYNGRINFKIKSMAYCKLPEIKQDEVALKSVNEEYYYIKPEPYINV